MLRLRTNGETIVRMMGRFWVPVSLLGLTLLAGCGDGGDGAKCVPGLTVACPCPTGQSGSQTCTSEGTFAACTCVGPTFDASGPGGAGGTTTAPSTGGTSGLGGAPFDAPNAGMGGQGPALLDAGPAGMGGQEPVLRDGRPAGTGGVVGPVTVAVDASEMHEETGPPTAGLDGATLADLAGQADSQDVPSLPTGCGDGVAAPAETCDDGNTLGGDGCSAACRVEPGFKCSGSPSKCSRTTCGDGKKEGSESCDDGNTVPFDGCSATCEMEPKCGSAASAVGACSAICGDGLLFRGVEECDDGNAFDGDGCSRDCKVESGWTCKSFFDDPPPKLQIPIISRDFQDYSPNSTPPIGHPDFGHYCCDDSLQRAKGVVRSTLDANHKPVWAGPDQDPIPEMDAKQLMFTGKKEFDQWYHDDSTVNRTIYSSLTLLQDATNKTTYAMNSDTDQPWYDLCGFFPLDDLTKPKIDQNTGKRVIYTETRNNVTTTCYAYEGLGFGNGWANHNFSHATELHYWFQYQGGENLKFTSDKDGWVFINGTLTVEMPGIHNRAVGTVILDAANGKAQVGYGEPPRAYTTVDLNLAIGSVYEVDVFHAERWCCGSNLMVTLANPLAGRSECLPAGVDR
jgi:fibro-slime domain-containing protein